MQTQAKTLGHTPVRSVRNRNSTSDVSAESDLEEMTLISVAEAPA
jgi:hypothetical protein